jgi:hypothetical protein
MCGASSPPAPQAPPPPPTARDAQLEGTRNRQQASARGARSGAQSTMLTGAGGLTDQAPTAKATLGG